MKLPGFLKGLRRKAEDQPDTELEYPGNAADEFTQSHEENQSRSTAESLPSPEPAQPADPEQKAETVSLREADASGTESEVPAANVVSGIKLKPDAPASKDAHRQTERAQAPAKSAPAKSKEPAIQREPDSVESIWFSLIDNPNNEKNLNLLIRYCQSRKGPAAVNAALSELAMEEDSFLPQLILASRALERKEPKEALLFYEGLLSRGTPNDYTLLRMSADLGRHGYPGELIRLIMSSYIPEKHNVYIGMNLLQACKESGKTPEGRRILEKLNAIKHPSIAADLQAFEAVFRDEEVRHDTESYSESISDPVEDASTTAGPTSEASAPAERRSADMPIPEGSTSLTDSYEASSVISDEPEHRDGRPYLMEVPIWKLWVPTIRDILPVPETTTRVGLFLYSDTTLISAEEERASSKALSIGLPILLSEQLLFGAPVNPIMLMPLSFSKGPDTSAAEPDVEDLFSLCAKESLNFLIAGTIGADGNKRTIRSWILDRAQNTARVISHDAEAENFGAAIVAHIGEIIAPFLDKGYAFEAKRMGFTYSAPSASLIESHLDALMRLGLRALVDSGLCSSDILCPQKAFLESLAILCRAKPFSQNYLMMLLSGMVSDRENGGDEFVEYRELLYETAHKLQYTPCVTNARRSIDKVLML